MSKRLIETIKSGTYEIKTYRDSEWDEYVVKTFEFNWTTRKMELRDEYFTSDKDDALATAEVVSRRMHECATADFRRSMR